MHLWSESKEAFRVSPLVGSGWPIIELDRHELGKWQAGVARGTMTRRGVRQPCLFASENSPFSGSFITPQLSDYADDEDVLVLLTQNDRDARLGADLKIRDTNLANSGELGGCSEGVSGRRERKALNAGDDVDSHFAKTKWGLLKIQNCSKFKPKDREGKAKELGIRWNKGEKKQKK